MLYSERAQVQNGSDAAALAVAQKCAANTSDPNCSTTSPIASDIANKNANDGLNNIKSISLDLTNRKVTVTAGAQQAGGTPNAVSLFFARVLGFSSSQRCDHVQCSVGERRRRQNRRFPSRIPSARCRDTSAEHSSFFRTTAPAPTPAATTALQARRLPVDTAGSRRMPACAAARSTSRPAKAAALQGTAFPRNCSTTLQKWADTITAGRDVIVLLPVFTSVTGTGSGAVYHLVSFAAFKVTGWKFSGNNSLPDSFRNTNSDVSNALACTGTAAESSGASSNTSRWRTATRWAR